MKFIAFALSVPLIALVACSPLAPETETATGDVDVADVAETEATLMSEGQAIVEQNCAMCHATSTEGVSPRTDAPPLRYVLANYDSEALSDDFREHIHVGHPDMPDFDFGPLGTEAVVTYLRSIQEPVPAEANE